MKSPETIRYTVWNGAFEVQHLISGANFSSNIATPQLRGSTLGKLNMTPTLIKDIPPSIILKNGQGLIILSEYVTMIIVWDNFKIISVQIIGKWKMHLATHL